MTYMSIPQELDPFVKRGELLCLPSSLFGFDTARMMFVSPSVMEAVSQPFPQNHGLAERHSEFRQFLDAFLEHGSFSIAASPYNKPSDAMIARVDPVEYEIWDLRSTIPSPGIRCLGAFFEQDVFVALMWEYREDINGKEDWDGLISDCSQEWCRLGLPQRKKRRHVDDYLTNCHEV